ncbi:MAG: response regulator transcription factor [Anaerolineales bacterium]|jgi:two-component system KDP operon response regulator KdpE
MTNDVRVLVVDDEKSLRDFVRRNLEVRSYSVETAANGLEALALMQQQTFDLVILDLMMPNMDGLETTRKIRMNSRVPIIVLTALGEETDKIQAFEMGVDDYLTKPFGVGELLARVRAVLRRTSWEQQPPIQGEKIINRAGVTIDIDRRQVTYKDREINLTPTEFNLLYQLMKEAGKVLTHRDLLQRVWGQEYGGETEYVRVYIGRLRSKLEDDPNQPSLLRTIRGVGYSFTID